MKILGIGLLAGILLLALAGSLQKQRFDAARERSARAEQRAPEASRVAFAGADSFRVADLYVTESCGYCAAAKRYLDAHGIAFRELDIGERAAWESYRDAGGQGGVPYLVVGERRQRGFSEAAYDQFFGRT